MNANGKELLDAIKSMRNFLGDVSKLLRTVDGQMGELGWDSIWGSTCIREVSGSVSAGHLWMAREAARPYKNKDAYPNLITMVSVLLDDYQNPYKLSEPLLSGSYFVYKEEAPDNMDFWQCRWFGWCLPSLDGTPIVVDESSENYDEYCKWKYMKLFARPLVEITNETLLKQMIIDPLVKLIEDDSREL